MPVYEFYCETCGSSFEKHLNFGDNIDHVACSQGHLQTKRVFSKPSIIFKGNGFYINDNRTSNKSLESS